jgi:hypothetical protein
MRVANSADRFAALTRKRFAMFAQAVRSRREDAPSTRRTGKRAEPA